MSDTNLPLMNVTDIVGQQVTPGDYLVYAGSNGLKVGFIVKVVVKHEQHSQPISRVTISVRRQESRSGATWMSAGRTSISRTKRCLVIPAATAPEYIKKQFA